MKYGVGELNAALEKEGDLTLELSNEDAKFLGELITAYYDTRRYRKKTWPQKYLTKLKDKLRWKRLMRQSFKSYPNVNDKEGCKLIHFEDRSKKK